MTDQRKAGGADRRADGSDFDLVEDIGDAAAFDRALDELIPKGELGQPGRFDIDPDDFEAFNRELDAQMAQAKARAARHEAVEDLGIDVIAPPVAGTPPPGIQAAPAPAPATAGNEPEVEDDRVTLSAATAPARPKQPEPPAPPHESSPMPATAPPSTPAAPAGRGPGLAVLLALAGLAAGGAAIWISLDREAELARLRADLAARDAAAVVPTTAPAAPGADPARVRELEGRLEEVSRRLAQLSSAPAEAPKPPAEARAAAPQVEARAAPPPHAEPPAPAAPPAVPVVAKMETRLADPVKPTEAPPAAPPARAETPPTLAAPASTPTAAATPPAPASAAAASPPAPDAAASSTAAPAQSLPKPSGNGTWAVVIDSYAEESDAEKRRAQVERMSLPAEVRWFLVKDEVRYRVIVPGYSTQEAANTAAAELRRRKAGGAWVMRLPKQN
jgi:hypothetical protein